MYKNFLKYALRKLAIMILTVFLISFAVFFIITLPPGDFLTNYIGRMADAGEAVSPELIAELRAHYGLDQSFVVQYWKWISNIIFHGDFGYSFLLSMPVTSVIKAYIAPTMILSLVTFAKILAAAIEMHLASPLITGICGIAMPGIVTASLTSTVGAVPSLLTARRIAS